MVAPDGVLAAAATDGTGAVAGPLWEQLGLLCVS